MNNTSKKGGTVDITYVDYGGGSGSGRGSGSGSGGGGCCCYYCCVEVVVVVICWKERVRRKRDIKSGSI